MFNQRFSHYLTYGATDQHTIINLAEVIDGLVVPSTIASFQRDGTGGFVLTLSASQTSPDYIIDPRFPLFQQSLQKPKRSHEALAGLLGDADLVRYDNPSPSDFDDKRLTAMARRWIDFNLGYTNVTSKFEKYAKRLDESVITDDSKAPSFILAPYFMASGVMDPWWERSQRFYEVTRGQLENSAKCIQVIALTEANNMPNAIDQVTDSQIAIWIDDLSELESTSDRLVSYLKGIAYANSRNIKTFSLYGGFFSVLASNVGLNGSCHGIGFGEHRRWIELPSSGPPPARFYDPLLHRYISQEDAFSLWQINKELFQCKCVECEGKSPIQLKYHELMKHSVHCRHMEIEQWMVGAENISSLLAEERDKFGSALDLAQTSERIKDRLFRLGSHVPRWIYAFNEFA